MNNELKIDFDWLGDASSADVEVATFADLSIRIGEHVATKVEDSVTKSVRGSVRVATFALAEWFAANWWRLRWEPERGWEPDSYWDPEQGRTPWEMSHKVAAAGNGYLWPNLSISSDGEMVRFVSQPTKPGEFKLVHYLEDFAAFVSAKEFERVLDNFIEATVARSLHTTEGEDMKLLWDEVCAERNDPEQAAWRKLEAILGYDPDDAPAELLEALQKMEQFHGRSAVEEMAAASAGDAPQHLDALAQAAQSSRIKLQMSEVSNLSNQIQETPKNQYPSMTRPWQRAHLAAENARKAWHLKPGPVPSDLLRDILKISQKDWEPDGKNRQLKFSAGYQGREGASLSVFLHSPHPSSQRFALVRLIGDRLSDRDAHEPLTPITSAKTNRQQFQKAFAQEFLCPLNDLKNFIDGHEVDDDSIESAAEHFAVSPLLIRTTLVNNGLMDRDTLEAYQVA